MFGTVTCATSWFWTGDSSEKETFSCLAATLAASRGRLSGRRTSYVSCYANRKGTGTMNSHAMVLLWLVIYIAQSLCLFTPPALENPLPRLQYSRELLLALDTFSPPVDLEPVSFDGLLGPRL